MDFGGLRAVDKIDATVESGEIVALIGPNGAGKTTVFNLITGVYKPTGGHVFFDGEDITGLKPHCVTQKGIVRTFQVANLFHYSTGMVNMRGSRAGMQPSMSAVYVAEVTSGQVAAYGVLWSKAAYAAGRPVSAAFIPLGKAPFRAAAAGAGVLPPG